MLLPEAGAIYVVDRGYVDFARLYVLHQAGAFFVTRAKLRTAVTNQSTEAAGFPSRGRSKTLPPVAFDLF